MQTLRIIPKYSNGAGFGIEDDTGHICTFEDAPDAEAYAPIFAAAPELLAALKAQLAYEAAPSGPGRPSWLELVKMRDAALAKASRP